MQNKIDLKSNFGLTHEELDVTFKSYSPESMLANQYFLKQGFVSDKIGFVKEGLLRAFFYTENGEEITTHFFTTGSYIISYGSFNNQTPSKENIIAVENSELMTVNYQKQKELYLKIPQWNQICKDLADIKSREMIERTAQFQTLTATERYNLFCADFPEVIKKVSLRHISSYLGIDIATLSRIRKKR